MPDLRAAVPRLLPKAVEWAEKCEAEIFRTGVALDDRQLAIARRVGVSQPERIRIKLLDGPLPLPADAELQQIGREADLFRHYLRAQHLFLP